MRAEGSGLLGEWPGAKQGLKGARGPVRLAKKLEAGFTGAQADITCSGRSIVPEPDHLYVFGVAAANVKQRKTRDVFVGFNASLRLNAQRDVTEVGPGEGPDEPADRIRWYRAAN